MEVEMKEEVKKKVEEVEMEEIVEAEMWRR